MARHKGQVKNPSVSIDLGARVNTSGYGEKAAKKYHFFETMFFLKRLMYDSLYDPYFSSTIQRSLKGQHHSNKPKLETIRKESQRFVNELEVNLHWEFKQHAYTQASSSRY